jgi:predicted membrane-bound spermidine synthase
MLLCCFCVLFTVTTGSFGSSGVIATSGISGLLANLTVGSFASKLLVQVSVQKLEVAYFERFVSSECLFGILTGFLALF